MNNINQINDMIRTIAADNTFEALGDDFEQDAFDDTYEVELNRVLGLIQAEFNPS